MIGQIIGNYKIVGNLGEGGVGMVYQGVDTMLDREVAVKVLRPELASQTAIVERFRSEAVTLAKLNHPNIATLYALFRQGNELYMVMEFVRGESLAQILHRRRALPAEEAIPIFCQALDGINHAHELGIVHRDIKPGNMILTPGGVLKVLDFGIARLLGSSRMTRVGNIIGTLEYMSPEQVRGQETDARSDIYALGIMLYEILTGRLPFESENEFALMKAQTEEIPALPRIINPNISVEVEAAIMRAVAKNPDERFQTAGEFMETLFDAGFSIDPTIFGFKTLSKARISRPSKPGIERFERSATPSGKDSVSKSDDARTLVYAEKIEEKIAAVPAMPAPEMPSKNSKETRLADNLATAETSESARENQLAHEVKGTRLAENAAAAAHFSANSAEIKATRFETPIQTADFDASSKGEPKQSFFSRLTWVHFAGAGAAVVLLFAAATLAVVVPMMFAKNSVPAEHPKPLETKLIEEKAPETIEPAIKQSVEPTPMVQESPAPREEEIVSPTPEQQLESNSIQRRETVSQPEPIEIIEPATPKQSEPSAPKTVRKEPLQTPKPKSVAPSPAPKPQPKENPSGRSTNTRRVITVN
jgi:serine/threonine protein kinase